MKVVVSAPKHIFFNKPGDFIRIIMDLKNRRRKKPGGRNHKKTELVFDELKAGFGSRIRNM